MPFKTKGGRKSPLRSGGSIAEPKAQMLAYNRRNIAGEIRKSAVLPQVGRLEQMPKLNWTKPVHE